MSNCVTFTKEATARLYKRDASVSLSYGYDQGYVNEKGEPTKKFSSTLENDVKRLYFAFNSGFGLLPYGSLANDIGSQLVQTYGFKRFAITCKQIRSNLIEWENAEHVFRNFSESNKKLATACKGNEEYAPLVDTLLRDMSFNDVLQFLGFFSRVTLDLSCDPSEQYDEFLRGDDVCKRMAIDFPPQIPEDGKEFQHPGKTKDPSVYWESYLDYKEDPKTSLKTCKGSEDKRECKYFSLTPRKTTDLNKNGICLQVLRSVFTYIFKDYKRNSSLFRLPPGATVECKRSASYLTKFKKVLSQQHWLREHGLEIPHGENLVDLIGDPGSKCRIMGVPKDISKPRLIAPESVTRQVFGYQASDGMYQCLRFRGADTHDQTRNQALCAIAREAQLATEDQHAASDSVSVWLTAEICGNTDLWNDLCACRSRHVEIHTPSGSYTYVTNRHSCMGNTTTFNLETGIFLSMAVTCFILDHMFDDWFYGLPNHHWHVGDKPLSTQEKEQCAERAKRAKGRRVTQEYWDLMIEYAFIELLDRGLGVYGDDVVLPAEYHEMFNDISTIFGFTINKDKSFAKGAYFESCGVEYWNGVPLLQVKFKRGEDISYTTLVSLQHKLVNYPKANAFLSGELRKINPRITTSAIGSTHDDLWVGGYLRYPVRNSDYAVRFTMMSKYVEPGCPCCRWRSLNQAHIHLYMFDFDTNRYVYLTWLKAGELSKYRTKRKRTGKGNFDWHYEFDLPDSALLALEEGYRLRCEASGSIPPRFRDYYHREPLVIGRYVMPNRFELLRRTAGGEAVDFCRHSTVVAKPVGDVSKLTETDKRLLELLAYLYAIGGGRESTNSDPYTDPERRILDRRSFVYDNHVVVEDSEYFD